jgi:hypothetical protein
MFSQFRPKMRAYQLIFSSSFDAIVEALKNRDQSNADEH